MDTVGKKSSPLPLFSMSIGLLLLWGAVFVQFAGSSPVRADISDLFSRDKKELFQALLTSGNPPCRSLRSNRQRNNTFSRTFNSRSGFGGTPQFDWTKDLLVSGNVKLRKTSDLPLEKHDYWNDFIISALPERAGPLFA